MSNTTTSKTRDDLRAMYYRAFKMVQEAEAWDEYGPTEEGPTDDELVTMFEDEGYDMAEIGRYLLAGFLNGEVSRGFVQAGHEVQTFNIRTTADFNR